MRNIKFSVPELYFIYGKHPVLSAFKNSKRKILSILVNKNNFDDIKDALYARELPSIKISILSNSEITNKIGVVESVHQGVAILVQKLKMPTIEEIINQNKKRITLLFLDQMNDPHNIGAIIRSAAAFGVDAVITTRNHAPSENSTIIKSSSGAFEYIPYIQVTNMSRVLKLTKNMGFWVASITQNGDIGMDSIVRLEKISLILGAEGCGIRKINIRESDFTVSIKMSNKLESINVSNAAAIVLHQLYSANMSNK